MTMDGPFRSGLLLTPLLLFACNIDNADWEGDEVTGVGVSEEGVVLEPVEVDPAPTDTAITYSNERFRDVRVHTVAPRTFRITGEAQVFEGNISWTIEDGHNVLNEGHETTSAGAPEWGAFDFTVTASKERENSTLHLVLHENSAKDGSRQHELPILLY